MYVLCCAVLILIPMMTILLMVVVVVILVMILMMVVTMTIRVLHLLACLGRGVDTRFSTMCLFAGICRSVGATSLAAASRQN